jgi:pyruvate dehydrogenase E1 component
MPKQRLCSYILKGYAFSFLERAKEGHDFHSNGFPMNTKTAFPTESRFSEEVAEWIEAFDDVIVGEGPEQGAELLAALRERAAEAGVATPLPLTTPYANTIPKEEEVPYPGDRAMERRIESLIRWNAMAMVHAQNKKDPGIGGHIAT